MFFTEIKRKKGLPFIPSKVTHEEYEPNKKLVNIIEESKNGKNIKIFSNKKDFFDSLDVL